MNTIIMYYDDEADVIPKEVLNNIIKQWGTDIHLAKAFLLIRCYSYN